jgi:DNA polymerase-3 subunit gamma/tau
MLLALYRNIRFSLNQRFELELLLSRLAQLDRMIEPAEVRAALREMRGELLAVSGGKTAAPRVPEQTNHKETPVDPGQALKKIVETLRREKPALASALDKVSAVMVEGEELVLSFSAKERFQGDVVLKDKDMLAARFAVLLSRPVRIKLAFHEVKTEPVEVDQRVELLRKVFRGEVVKGEGHGDQSV